MNTGTTWEEHGSNLGKRRANMATMRLLFECVYRASRVVAVLSVELLPLPIPLLCRPSECRRDHKAVLTHRCIVGHYNPAFHEAVAESPVCPHFHASIPDRLLSR